VFVTTLKITLDILWVLKRHHITQINYCTHKSAFTTSLCL